MQLFSESTKMYRPATGMPRHPSALPQAQSNVFVLYNKSIDRSDTVRDLMFHHADPTGRQDTKKKLLTGPSRISKSSQILEYNGHPVLLRRASRCSRAKGQCLTACFCRLQTLETQRTHRNTICRPRNPKVYPSFATSQLSGPSAGPARSPLVFSPKCGRNASPAKLCAK